MDAKSTLASEIGNMVIRLHETQAYALQQEEERIKAWGLLAMCIKSGQIAQEHVPTILELHPQFANWFKTSY